jgi:hypothetical protein
MEANEHSFHLSARIHASFGFSGNYFVTAYSRMGVFFPENKIFFGNAAKNRVLLLNLPAA